MHRKWLYTLLAAGAFTGVAAVTLTALGNPANMGICVACFFRDIAGALGLHSAAPVQYLRPEIAGFLLGSFVLAKATGEFRPSGGSSPLLRLVIAAFVMIGALMFLGCPLRMVLRLAGGDGNALFGLAGFAAGIGMGSIFLRGGFSLGRSQSQPRASGWIMPAAAAALLAFLVLRPAFIRFSDAGPGSQHAPIAAALLAGLLVGALAQRSRLCMAGGIRDVFLIRNFTLLVGYAAVFAAALAGNLLLGRFSPGFEGQPVAHTDSLWNFLGMALAGLGSVMLGGCPLRQTVLAGEGDADGAVSVTGLLLGAAAAHNFGLASSAQGPTANGQTAVVAGFIVLAVIAFACMRRKGGAA